ncbi:MAG: transglycosylase domain-containing protein, partial [Myxococcota bacterium]
MGFIRSRGFKVLLAIVGFLVMVGAGAGGVLYWTLLRDLPDLRTIQDYRPPLASHVVDRHNRLIGEYFTERRALTSFEAIPDYVINAFVAGEDSSFFEHSGIDLTSILRAAWVNLRAGGEIRQGGSTITQQMVKGLLLSPERKIRRKVREMILARDIEKRFTKQEILYLYLNQIYFGNGAYGIGEAAQTYFAKDGKDLTVSEGAMLAGLPKAPSRYSPFHNSKEAETRRRYVLSRMHVEGFLDAAGYSTAIAELPVLADRTANQDDPAAAYFTEEVRRTLFNQFGGKLVLESGLTIETTLDRDLQRAATQAVRTGLIDLDHRQGYRGPIRRVAPSDIPEEIDRLAEANQLHLEISDPVAPLDSPEPAEPIDEAFAELPGEAERAAARRILGEEGGVLLGVITAVDAESTSARVAFAPDVEGVVRLEDVDWAREPDPNHLPRKVLSIGEVFTEGDVARFGAVHSQEGEIDQALVRGTRRMCEIAFFHRSSRVLILTDLVEKIADTRPGQTT